MATQTIVLSNNSLDYRNGSTSYVKLNFNQTTLKTDVPNSELTGNLSVAGNSILTGNLNVNGNSNLTGNVWVTGTSTLYKDLVVNANSTISGDLRVIGNSSLTALKITGPYGLNVVSATTLGSLTVTGTFNQTGAVTTTGESSITGNSTITGNLSVAGNSNITKNLTVIGNSVLGGSLTVNGGSVVGSLNVVGNSILSGRTDLSGDLSVNGNSTFSGIGGMKIQGPGGVTVAGPATLSNNLSVAGNSALSNLKVTGSSTLIGDLTVTGNFNISGNSTTINTTELTVTDRTVTIGQGNTGDVTDMAINMMYDGNKYAGLKRIAGSKTNGGSMVLFKGAASSGISEAYGQWFTVKLTSTSANRVLSNYAFSINSFADQTSFKSWYLLGSNDDINWVYVDFQDTTRVMDAPEKQFVSFDISNNTTAYLYYRFVLRKYNTTYPRWGLNMALKMGDNASIVFTSDSTYIGASPDVNLSMTTQLFSAGTSTYGQITGSGNAVTVMGALDYGINTDYTGTDFLFTKIPVAGTTTVYTGDPSPVTGDLYADLLLANITCFSDMNLKKNIVNIDGTLDKLDRIRGVYHHWIDTKQSEDRQIGVIAQEIQAVYPELVHENENGYLTVNYPKLTAVLLQSIKELKAMVLAICAKQA